MRVLFLVLLGMGAGVLVYRMLQLSGWSLFAAIGGFAGLAAGILLHGHRRAMRLTEVTVSVPQLGKLKFTVTAESQQVAWRLFVELATRISTQPLHDDSGRLRSALNSLHGLLAFIRELLKENPPSRRTGTEPTVEQLAITLLNNELRPFLTFWHRSLHEWQEENPTLSEAHWPLNSRCRTELLAMQSSLRGYVLTFGELAAVPNAQEIISGALAVRNRTAVTRAALINVDG